MTTPGQNLVDSGDVAAVRAEDESGSFGILPGHADLLTALVPTVVRWRTADGSTHFCAVRGGVFTVSAGHNVSIACREGVLGDSLEDLEAKVRAVRAQQIEADRKARVEQVRLQALAVRQPLRYLCPSPAAAVPIKEEAASGEEQTSIAWLRQHREPPSARPRVVPIPNPRSARGSARSAFSAGRLFSRRCSAFPRPLARPDLRNRDLFLCSSADGRGAFGFWSAWRWMHHPGLRQ
ncbi:MAG: F0F1 ATP synthase subunit epsilon [Stellaceae bacterium]